MFIHKGVDNMGIDPSLCARLPSDLRKRNSRAVGEK